MGFKPHLFRSFQLAENHNQHAYCERSNAQNNVRIAVDSVEEMFGLTELVCVFYCLACMGFVSYTYGILCEVVAVMALPVLILMFLLYLILKWEGGVVSSLTSAVPVHQGFP